MTPSNEVGEMVARSTSDVEYLEDRAVLKQRVETSRSCLEAPEEAINPTKILYR